MLRSRGLGRRRSLEKVPLSVEPECPLDEGTEWVVGCLTEMVLNENVLVI